MSMIYLLLSVQTLLVPKPVGFNFDLWESGLEGYYEKEYILQGIQDGFDIGLLDNHPEPTYIEYPSVPTDPTQDLAIADWLEKNVKKRFFVRAFHA